MKGAIIFLTLFSIIFHEALGAGYSFPIKTKVIGKFSTWLTKWLSPAQLVQLIDQIEPQLDETTTISEIQPMLISGVMAVTTFGQKLSVAALGSGFLVRPGGLNGQIAIVATALGNNLQAFSSQVLDMYAKYLDQGKTRQRVFQRSYKMIDMFMTKKRVSTIYCRVKKAYDVADPTNWPFIKSKLGTILLFTVLDGLGTCV